VLSSPADDAALGSPVVAATSEAANEPGSTQQVLNTAELHDYLTGQGEWMLPQDALSSSSNAAAGATAGVQQHAAVGRVVAELAGLAQKLQGKQLALPGAGAVTGDAGAEGARPVLTAAAAAAAAAEQSPEDAATAVIKAMPLKLAVVSIGGAEFP
jgi:hypothetical protein